LNFHVSAVKKAIQYLNNQTEKTTLKLKTKSK